MKNDSRHRNHLLRFVIALVALIAPWAPSATASTAYPPSPAGSLVSIIPSSQTVGAGSEFTVTVVGCTPGEPVPITFDLTVLAECIDGRAEATFRAPCEVGDYPISTVVGEKAYTTDITVTGSCDGFPTLWIIAPLLVAGVLGTGLALWLTLLRRLVVASPPPPTP